MCAIESNPCARAGIYARVSSEQQAQAQTIASQVEALEERFKQDDLRDFFMRHLLGVEVRGEP